MNDGMSFSLKGKRLTNKAGEMSVKSSSKFLKFEIN